MPSVLYAKIELPFLIGDNMVMQRREPIPVWGWSAPDTAVTLTFAGEKKTVHSDKNGAWHAVFSSKEAGGPYQLQISSGGDTRTVRDILVGDVWLCSGQSNMEWVLRNTDNAKQEIAHSGNNEIRHFKVPLTWSVAPSDRLAGGEWEIAGPDTSGEFTAVGYYFAKKVNAETGIPIGLLHSSWGGSAIEAWMSPAALGETDAMAADKMEQLVADAEQSAQSIKNKLSRWPGALVDRFKTADADWSAPDVDESDWIEISAPQLWEEDGLEGVDGVVWYRKTFHLDAKQAAAGVVLHLAKIDDNDITWVNGHKVGGTEAYNAVRRYEVPAEFLKTGDNKIAIRVEDTGGGGGIYSDAGLYVETADGQLPLTGMWKVKPDKVTVTMISGINQTATALYNKMLHPLFAFPIEGVLWYQGESNADNTEEAYNYRGQFENMIKDWRKSWHKPELAFYWVQLANFKSGANTAFSSPWAIVRDAQTAALELPNTGQAITIDVGNPDDIHPRDKKTVGTRLALIALNKVYGKHDISYSGPVLKDYKVDGAKVELNFSNSGSKLAISDGDSVNGFEIAGADRKYKPATALIQNNTVVVSNDSVEQPVAVRYAWDDNPEDANLIGSNKLSAGPFRLIISR